MRICSDQHLAYCTNVHPGGNWEETFHSLNEYTLKIKEKVSKDEPFAIGLRLSQQSALELQKDSVLSQFRQWMDKHNCYVFTINGFPYGDFNQGVVKEDVYRPDWSSTDRLTYTKNLFDILSTILPSGVSGSVSTLPGSFKEFPNDANAINLINKNMV